MPDVASPILVHTRIESNRRKSRWLLVLFGLLVVPFVLALVPALLTVVGILGAPLFTRHVQTPRQFLLAVLAVVVVAGVLVALTALAAWAELAHGSRLVLRLAGARRVTPDQEPALYRAVENLCIGAGLPPPQVHVVERDEPNAFAVGTEPSRASLVVTRGLLDRLRPRELHGVIAHELSHIANQDTRVGTVLAAMLATARLPIALLHRLHPAIAAVAVGLSTVLLVISMLGALSVALEVVLALWFFSEEVRRALPALDVTAAVSLALLFGYGLLFASSPSYLLLGGHLLGRLIGGHVSREREFLADADAVMLTRDPEALALALVKIQAAQGAGVSTSATAAHLFIVAPAPGRRPWWDRPIHSHPPIGDRVAVLERMGPGISRVLWGGAAGDAVEPGAPVASRPATPRPVAPAAHAPPPAPPPEAPTPPASSGDPAPGLRLSPGLASYARAVHATPLLDVARGDAAVRGRIAAGEVIALLGLEGAFLLVQTAAGATGYITDTTKLSWELR